MTDTIRILRVIEYTGERERVEDVVAKSVHGEKRLPGLVIRAATIGAYPEVLISGTEETECQICHASFTGALSYQSHMQVEHGSV